MVNYPFFGCVIQSNPYSSFPQFPAFPPSAEISNTGTLQSKINHAKQHENHDMASPTQINVSIVKWEQKNKTDKVK